MADIVWDTRPLYVYAQTPKEHYEVIDKRYKQFLDALNDESKEPVTVFNPLKKKMVDELDLIRGISEVLQEKKNEDIRKSKAAAEAADEETEQKEKEEVTETEDAPAETKPAV